MDLSKFKNAFEKMGYDNVKANKSLIGTRSFVIVTETSDLEAASDFILASLQSDDLFVIKAIFAQESISKKFETLLREKIEGKSIVGVQEVEKFVEKGFETIGKRIVKCPSTLLDSNEPIISLDVFRTTKEVLSLAKSAQSVSLWCQNISVSFEYIHGLTNVYQIWLNSTHASTHPKIPFFINGGVINKDTNENTRIEVNGNVQFQTTFQEAGKFKTVVIPFGETFAN